MSPLKMVVRGALVLVAVAAIALLFFAVGLEDIIKRVIQDVGSAQTGTEVRLDRVELDLSSGRGALHNLTIANPEGYPDDTALAIGQVVLQIEPSSLSGGVIQIREASLDAGSLALYQRGKSNNLSVLLDNMQESADTVENTEDELPPEASEMRLAIETLSVTGVQIALHSETGQEKTVSLPDYIQSGIGDPKTGLTPAQLSDAVVQEILRRAEQAALRELRKAAEKEVQRQLDEKLDDGEKKALKGLKSLLDKDD